MDDRTKLTGLIWNKRLFAWIDDANNRDEDARPDADDVAEYVDTLTNDEVREQLAKLNAPDLAFARDCKK